MGAEPETAVLKHCRAVARELPLIGFYLQPAVGGRDFLLPFWRGFAEIPQLVAIKIAPFNRYRTLDVVRAVLEAGRDDVALYTGNDDNIVAGSGHAASPSADGPATSSADCLRPVGRVDQARRRAG